MKLSVYDRIALLSILPKQGNMGDMKVVKMLRGMLDFTVYERQAIDLITQPNGDVSWKPNEVEDKEINISSNICDFIQRRLKYMDSQSLLSEGHVGIWNKFVSSSPELEE
jgi:hypothetical protein